MTLEEYLKTNIHWKLGRVVGLSFNQEKEVFEEIEKTIEEASEMLTELIAYKAKLTIKELTKER